MSDGKIKAKFCQADGCYNQPKHITLNRWDKFCIFHQQPSTATEYDNGTSLTPTN